MHIRLPMKQRLAPKLRHLATVTNSTGTILSLFKKYPLSRKIK